MAQGTRTAIVVGATGLVGRACVAQLLGASTWDPVVALARAERPATATSARLRWETVDFERIEAAEAPSLVADVVFCALGTTLARAGSRERFRAIDYGYTLACARRARADGTPHFVLVTSLGASPRAAAFYSRVKGELEEAVVGLGFPSTTIVRPSLLLGERTERRPAEAIAQRLARLAAPLVPATYEAIGGDRVAAAMIALAHDPTPGVRIVESAELHRLAAGAGR